MLSALRRPWAGALALAGGPRQNGREGMPRRGVPMAP